LGVLFIIFAGACIVAEILHLVVGDGYSPVAIGEIWYAIDGNSLVGFQALIEKSISPYLWTPIQSLLSWPGWLVAGVPALLLMISCRPRPRGFEGFR
jgi:hypothetical protein